MGIVRRKPGARMKPGTLVITVKEDLVRDDTLPLRSLAILQECALCARARATVLLAQAKDTPLPIPQHGLGDRGP